MIVLAYMLCLLGSLVLGGIFLIIGDFLDHAHIKKAKALPFAMHVKRTYLAARLFGFVVFFSAFLTTYFCWADALADVLFFLIVLGVYALGFLLYCMYLAGWKVVVLQDGVVARRFGKKRKYSYDDIFVVHETKKSIWRKNIVLVYDVFVGESEPTKTPLFSMYNRVIGCDLFIAKMRALNKVKYCETIYDQ